MAKTLLILLPVVMLACRASDSPNSTMESRNPFIQRIHAASKHIDSYEPITAEDAKRYPLRGQNFKFTRPEKFSFIDMPVEFIAMEVDEEQRVKSMLLYLDQHETMQSTLTIAYGTPALTLDIEGTTEDASGETQDQTHTSHTWMLHGYRLTLTVLPLRTGQTETVMKAQIYIE